MKTAVSIPDALFEEAERLAKGLRLSRSSLYARALARYVEEASSAQVTAALNQVYAKEQIADEFIGWAAESGLKDEDW